ncbi:hypothetical protein OAH18_03170, partial [bacterium]|nr:hypothetical protein [bacterium]
QASGTFEQNTDSPKSRKQSPKREAKGHITFQTQAIRDGLRVHGEFKHDAVGQLMLVPDYIMLGLSLAFD